VVANSWQQTPAGYHLVGQGLAQRAEITSFWAVVFNPSTVDRLTHTLIGAFILGGFFVMSVSAYYLLKGRHQEFARRSIRIALPYAALFSLAALVTGHSNARMVGRHQPSKLAAFEGHFKTQPGGTPLYLFGHADQHQERVRFGLPIPGSLSFLLYGDWDRPVPALDDPAIVPGGLRPGTDVRDYWPPVNLSFQTYHGMVGLGMLFIALTVYASILLWRGTLFGKRWLLWLLVFAAAGPMIANQLGWAAAEVGRQPWIVWGLLRTADAASKSVSGQQVLASIIAFGLIYLLLLATWLFIMLGKIKTGPESPEQLADLGNPSAHVHRSEPGASATGHRSEPGASATGHRSEPGASATGHRPEPGASATGHRPEPGASATGHP
jgi:cytochrome d ubiquinol oxidase subunit I